MAEIIRCKCELEKNLGKFLDHMDNKITVHVVDVEHRCSTQTSLNRYLSRHQSVRCVLTEQEMKHEFEKLNVSLWKSRRDILYAACPNCYQETFGANCPDPMFVRNTLNIYLDMMYLISKIAWRKH